jgi:hypothetical protein
MCKYYHLSNLYYNRKLFEKIPSLQSEHNSLEGQNRDQHEFDWLIERFNWSELSNYKCTSKQDLYSKIIFQWSELVRLLFDSIILT